MSLEDVAYLASEQAGLFTTAQAASLGVDRVKLHRGVQSGTLRSPRRGVYIFESSPFTLDEELRAAWLSLDPSRTVAERLRTPEGIVICTTSAAAHYGIGDFETPQHEFYTARRKQTRAEDIRLRVRSLDAGDIDIVQGLPLTTPTRIVLDLLTERFDLGHISRMIADAVKQGLHIDWPRIAKSSSDSSAEYGLSAESLLSALAEASESVSDTARTALSMIRSHPELSRSLNDRLATSMGEISKIMVSSPLAEIPEHINRIFNESSAVQEIMQEMKNQHGQFAVRIVPQLPAVSSKIPYSFELKRLGDNKPLTREKPTDADEEE